MMGLSPVAVRYASMLLLFFLPVPAVAIFDFGGWVLNTPSTPDSIMGVAAAGTNIIYPPCINGVEEVNIQSPPTGVQSPPILLQFIGAYTYSVGPARFPGQQVLGKYVPIIPCIAIFLIPCGPFICPIPLPFFFAPLILFNGSSSF